MSGILDSVKTLNSVVRTVLFAALVGVIGMAGYLAYSEYTKRERELLEQAKQIESANRKLVLLEGELRTKDEELKQLAEELRRKEEHIQKLNTAMQLLKTDQRLARLDVVAMERDDAGRVTKSKLAFAELSPQGVPLSEPKIIELPGDIVYVDNWIVKFDDKYVENGDIARGTSLCLFRRIFSEEQRPTEGISLDEVGMRPQAYSTGGAITEFEKQLWDDFWEIANNPQRAAELGIRAANGEAVSIQIREGMTYIIELRSSGGLSIRPKVRPNSDEQALLRRSPGGNRNHWQ